MEKLKEPFFSIVVANLNHGTYLEAALRSVLEQSCQDFELIVVDGGSNDSSLDVIEKYKGRIAWWCSEKDRGQSHAFNKGFSRATGRYFTWLNADDLLLPEALKKAKKKLLANPKTRWMTANFIRFLNDETIFECKWGPHFLPTFLQNLKSPIVVFGPTAFFSKNLFNEVGEFDESLYFTMDTDLWLRFIAMGETQIRLNHYCWAFRMHEESKTAEFAGNSPGRQKMLQLKEERETVFQKNKYSLRNSSRYLSLALRVLDGSLFIYMWNQTFWKGRSRIDLVHR